MVDVWEEYADKRADNRDKETAINFFKNGVPIETIIKSVPSLPAEFIEQLKQMPIVGDDDSTSHQLQNA